LAQEIHIHPRVIVETLKVTQCHEPAEIDVALPVHHEENEMMGDRASVPRGGPFFAMSRRHINFASQNGFDGFFGRFTKKLHSAEDVSVIGDGYALHP
jgi:hypothetical protein